MMQLELRVPLFLPEVSWRLCPDSVKSGYVCSLPSSLRKEQRVGAIGAIVVMKAHLPLLLYHSSVILYFFPITSEWKTQWLASPYPCQLFILSAHYCLIRTLSTANRDSCCLQCVEWGHLSKISCSWYLNGNEHYLWHLPFGYFVFSAHIL